MFRRVALLLVCIFTVQIIALPVSFAQGPVPETKEAEEIPAGYIIGPDDVLGISVVNFQNLSSQAVVLPDGTVTLPLLGSVKAEGKTTDEFAAVLAKEWDKFVVEPVVSVAITQKRSAQILVNGFVQRPGPMTHRPGLLISEVMMAVGGALPAGDLSQAKLTRRSGAVEVLDLTKPETIRGTDRDIELAEGDILFIPEQRQQISVVGEVNRPGSFEYRDEMKVLDVITLAGGLKETAHLSGAKLERNGVEEPLDLSALYLEGDMQWNKVLKPSDRIMIPEAQNRTYLFGAVARPGFYPYKEGDRLLDALDASGLAPQAELRQVRVIRVDRKSNTAVVDEIDLENFLKKGDMSANVALNPGDVVFIPNKKRPIQIQDIFGFLSGISILDSAVRVITGDRYR